MTWSDAERDRFAAGVLQALDDAGQKPPAIVAGSLRVMLGGSGVLVTWASLGSGKITQGRAELGPGVLAGIMHNAADKLIGGDGAGA